jgi:hypothetical protein
MAGQVELSMRFAKRMLVVILLSLTGKGVLLPDPSPFLEVCYTKETNVLKSFQGLFTNC